ncbi:MAG: RNA pseudouridine synthase [Gammaproteobacteria bacterium]|jgi:tRNA pseudouridine32 synthase/23S rRNA pseudouridine746 synthase|nr:RNA pseudouridine synthase [Gammaproteobacteria bacterium]
MTGMNAPQTFSVVIDCPQTAVAALTSVSGLPRSVLKEAMQKGAVWLQRGKKTQRIRRQDRLLKAQDTLFLYYHRTVLDQVCPAATLLADEGEFSVWYKPTGMLSQGSRWSDHCTINRWVEGHITPARTAVIVNRLDRAAQGLMLIAHSKAMARQLSGLFAQHKIHKAYLAKVEGQLIKPTTCTAEVDNKPALSHIQPLQSGPDRSLVKVIIETGRKHQIRQHLAGLGHPIVGDRLNHPGPYGEDLALVCSELAWIDNRTQAWRFVLPEHFYSALT